MVITLARAILVAGLVTATVFFNHLAGATLKGPFLYRVAQLDGEEVIVLTSETSGFPYGETSSGVIWAVDRETGEFMRELYSPKIAAKLLPKVDEWGVLGVDAHCRIYIGMRPYKVAIIDGTKVTVAEFPPETVIPVSWASADECIVGATRSWDEKVPGPCVRFMTITLPANANGRIQFTSCEIPSYSDVDIPGLSVDVSPDAEYIYTDEYNGTAWIHDRQGNLKGLIGLVFGTYSVEEMGFDKEQFEKLDRLYVETVFDCCFDRNDKLLIQKAGRYYFYSADGRQLSTFAGFQLTRADGKVLHSQESYAFAISDNHYFTIGDDALIYEYDLAPVFDLEYDDLHNLWFPGNKPPIFVRTIKIEYPPTL